MLDCDYTAFSNKLPLNYNPRLLVIVKHQVAVVDSDFKLHFSVKENNGMEAHFKHIKDMSYSRSIKSSEDMTCVQVRSVVYCHTPSEGNLTNVNLPTETTSWDLDFSF